MNLFFSYVALVISLIIWTWINMVQQRVSVDLVICVLSSQENFQQRSILRKEILKQCTNFSTELKFIVASEPCYVPVEERIDAYSCEPLQYSGGIGDSYYSHDIVNVSTHHNAFTPSVPVGWDFVVLQDITVEQLGFIDFEQNGIKGTIKVSVFDKFTKEPVLAAVFMSFSPGLLHKNFRYKPVLSFTAPKGFKGTIVVEGVTKDDPMLVDTQCKVNERNELLEVQKGFRFGKENGEFPEFLNEHITNPCFYIGPSIKFRSNVIVDTKKRQNMYEEHANNLKIQSRRLASELQEHGDLVLVELEETYRNLPRKMLGFYEWLLSSSLAFDFVLKTDDDCYLNITAITQELSLISKHGKSNIWVGNFREYFALDRQGKWAEHDYKSISYPPFACGSGYVLSSDIVEWISTNRDDLRTYQGEDTSLGIWLSAIRHKRIQEERFGCFQKCKPYMFSIPENSVEQLECLYANADDKDLCKLCFG